MPTDANRSATTANTPTNSAEKRREASRTVNDLFLIGTDIENRQVRIDCLNLTTLRICGSRLVADKEVRTVTLLVKAVYSRLVDRSVDVGSSGLVEAITVDVLDHANHDAPRRFGRTPRGPHAQTAANGIAVRPVGPSCAFIDDCHRLFVDIIVFREVTSAYLTKPVTP